MKTIRIEFQGFVETDPSELTFAYIGPLQYKPYINGLEYISLSENERQSYVLHTSYECISNYNDKEEYLSVVVVD